MQLASIYMNGITAPISTKTEGKENSLPGQEKKSSYELDLGMPFSSGATSLTNQDRKELIVLFSGTNQNTDHLTLSDRLTPSLISSGLVAGITPTSIRKRLGVPIPAFALNLLDGSVLELPRAD